MPNPKATVKSARIHKGGGEPAYTDQAFWEIYREHCGRTRKVAEVTGYSQRYVRERVAKIRDAMQATQGDVPIADVDHAEKMESLLAAIPRQIPGGGTLKEAKVTLYGIGAKDELTQKIIREGLDSSGGVYRFSQDVPDLPLVHAGTPIKVTYRPAPRILRKTQVLPVISDAQIGWLKHSDTGMLTPIHDPTALDVQKQIVAAIAPDGLIFIGDWVDWQFLSRWRQYREYDAANPSIKTGRDELGEMCAAAGKRSEKRRIMVGSNHADRPEIFLLERNLFAAGIRRGGDTSKWPVFSEPYLLQYEDFNIQFSGHYGSLYWVTPDLVCTHAPPKVREFDASVFHGHTHHLRMTPYVIHGQASRKERFIYDTGCSCRTDASTDKRRLMLLNVPSNQHRSDWTQGMAVINIVDGKFPIHAVDLIHIQNGHALYRGREFSASTKARKILREGVKAA